MKIQLSDHFTYKKLIRFTMPSIIMMVFTSIYGVVDGFFVSNFAGKTPFAAVNFIMPFLMILGALGSMLGAGGSALVGIALGEGKRDKANRLLSLFVSVSFAAGIVIAILGIIFLRPIASLMGAEGTLLEDSIRYGRIILAALPAFMLQYEFQSFFVTAEKPQLGLASTVASGVTNMVLDFLLVGLFSMGLEGAAIATALSQCVGGIIPVLYFTRPNTSLLRLLPPTKVKFDGKALSRACVNGSSELMSNISMSLVGMLYNIQLLRYAGENGVAAYGVLMYVYFIFISSYIGYTIGTAPVISYHFGAGNTDELKGLLRKSLVILSVCSVAMTVLGEALAVPFSKLFVGYDATLFQMTVRGFRISSFAFLFAGFGIFGSAFFTALNNGLISALISFLRTLIFQTATVIILPMIWEMDGIWFSVVAAEAMAVAITAICLALKQRKYNY